MGKISHLEINRVGLGKDTNALGRGVSSILMNVLAQLGVQPFSIFYLFLQDYETF